MDASMHLGTDGGYLDHIQGRSSSSSSSHSANLFLPEQGIEYHDPGSSSRLHMGANDDTSPANTSIALEGLNGSPFSRHLGRNRACASCRDRKLKCDGVRPICE